MIDATAIQERHELHIQAAREWLRDLQWRDLDPEPLIDEATDAHVVAMVDLHYDGGWTRFIRDGGSMGPGTAPRATLGGQSPEGRATGRGVQANHLDAADPRTRLRPTTHATVTGYPYDGHPPFAAPPRRRRRRPGRFIAEVLTGATVSALLVLVVIPWAVGRVW